MAIRTVVRRGFYQDSVTLMLLSTELSALEGIQQASALMATEANKGLLEKVGLLTAEARLANPNDLLLVIKGDSEQALQAAVDKAGGLLEQQVARGRGAEKRRLRTIAMGLDSLPSANLLLVSTPGPYAAAEALKGVKAGLHVFLFSDNVSLEQEVLLKRAARERGLLVMGPDCGTAIISGMALGFANVVDRGPVGVIGPSGTGIQQVTVLVHRCGVGISQAIGTGSHDLSEAVGGITTLLALDALAEDADTRVVVIVAKPSSPKVAQRVVERCRGLGKPVVVNFLGMGPSDLDWSGVVRADTLEDAASLAATAATGRSSELLRMSGEIQALVREARRGLGPEQRYLRGLFSGGTLCAEALVALQQFGLAAYSNISMRGALPLEDVQSSREHCCIDMGADEFTVGRPHPMIDFRARIDRLRKEARDPLVAVLLLDVVLGYGSHPNPAQELAPAIQRAKAEAERDGRNLVVVGSVCGTERDPQELDFQEKQLREAGMAVLPSNVQAARVAAAIATGRLEIVANGREER